jgi:hypothetical protein
MTLAVAPAGPQFTVNTQTTGTQDSSRVTGLTGGGYVVTWTDDSHVVGDPSPSNVEVKAQVFDAGDRKVGAELLVNTNVVGQQFGSTVAHLSNGGFVITWQDASLTLGDASGQSVKGQVFDALGNKVGSEFLVNTNTAGDQTAPQVTGLSGGGFAVSWTDASGTLGDASGTSVKAQVFDNLGNKVGAEVRVNTNTASSQNQDQIAALTNGNFVVTWTDASGTLGDASGTGVKGQVLTPAGGKVGAEFLVNTSTPGNQRDAVVAGLSGGGFAIVWAQDNVTARAQLFDNAGNRIGAEFTADSASGTVQLSPVGIAALSDGGFVVSDAAYFFSAHPLPNGRVQAFDAVGNKMGSLVDLGSNLTLPAVDGLTNGTFVVTGSPVGGAFGTVSDVNVLAQHFKFEQGPVVANPIPDQLFPQNIGENIGWSFQLAANTFVDPEGDPLTYSALTSSNQSLPAWLTFNASTRTFSGTPPQGFTGTISLKVTASDGAGTDSDTFDLTVFPVIFPANPGNVDEWILVGGQWSASAGPGSHPAGSRVAAVADFTHDGISDILWQNVGTGAVDIWKISNGAWAGSVSLGLHPGSGWQIAGAGDFNHDGTSDVLWFNPGSGETDIWLLQNGQWAASVSPGNHPTGYQVAGIGDFNHDGHGDVLWFNPTTGNVDEWSIVDGHWAGSTNLGSHPGSGWQISGIGDFNADGTSDVFWFNPGSGATDIWLLANGNWAGSVSPGNHPTGYQVAGIGDFNHDSHSDVLWYNPTTGNVDEWQLVNGHWTGSINFGSHPGTGWAIAGVGDFNGGGTSDVLWHQFV